MPSTDARRLRLSDSCPDPTSLVDTWANEGVWAMTHRHSHMLWACGALMVIAVVLAVAGAGWITFLAPLGCVVMMGAMLWMMVGMGRRHH